VLTLPIREIVAATPRARIVRIDLGRAAFSYAPGQAVLVATHGFEKRKPYSIAAAPEDARRDGYIELLVGVDADGGPGPHLTLEADVAVDVEGPVGVFTLPDNPLERRFIFIAGGTGIAPLRAMLRHALPTPNREFGLLYSARTPDEFAYEHEFKALAREGRLELRQTITRADGASWSGARGRISRADLQPLVHDPATLCFVCGPPALVDEIPRHLEELGVSRNRIKIEEWS
jgi:NAD(P)H-flavin reductase